ncbi:ABC transporter permease [Tuanshanicoccus lijuaniae]|uniref:ABC transporter permease n=2 Tax=Aerococcaceae bacterium zg-1292 TaxID=2774330 RepID=UPI0019365E4F|nr:ABC transporter permease [Aerococcaceae bacterium zg-1292]MBF6625485.1 ABC transporter permease [Aerococcaceae bacterium zg-BR9]MBF6977672.1 ABC transporter permease [Aerococcaceae bacterium zg-BR22]MBS4456892.1 ABC transporter permease [Aerococcaceae bacterium zg-A91]MBS4458722.1 ABC transporter permease [Aerococcaceae bacterium zg-BR33]
MRMSEIIKSSLATLRMNGRRTFLTMIGIIIGIAAVITILSLGNGYRKQMTEELAKDDKGRPSQDFHFNVTNYELDYEKIKPFTDKFIKEIEEIPGVDEVKTQDEVSNPTTRSRIKYANKEEASYEVGFLESTDYQMLAGRNLNSMDSSAYRRYVIIDNIVATNLFESVEAALHKTINIDETNYLVVGVYSTELTPEAIESLKTHGYSTTNAAQLIIPKGTYEEFRPYENINYSITVFYKPDVDIKAMNYAVSEFLKENGPEKENGNYTYYDTSEMMKKVGEQLQIVTYFISAIAGISLFIAGVGVMNMMYISVSERTKEIGIRRSLGATQQSIQWQFLLEGIMITTIGGIIGYNLGILIATVAGNFLPFKAAIDVPTAVLSVAISVFIGIVFSVFPARSAARKNVVEILR